MTKFFKLSKIGNLVLGIIIALFIAFFFYIFFAEDVAVFQRNQHHNYSHLVEMEPELVPDPQAPAGVRKVYRWTLESDYSWEDCLLIYFSHHELEVYLNDQLEYSITVDDSNRIAANVGSNWCSLHVGAHGTGTQVTVVMTPLFEAAIDKNPDIYFGAHYAITMDLLRGEIPPMVFSALCFFLGLVLVAVSLYFRFALNTSDNSMMYLGLFSLFLGLWKLTDLASMPLLMPGKSLALTYISVGSLFLTGPCLMMYFSTLFTEKGRRHMYLMVFVGSLICAVSCWRCCAAVTARERLDKRNRILYTHVPSFRRFCIKRRKLIFALRRKIYEKNLLYGGCLCPGDRYPGPGNGTDELW